MLKGVPKVLEIACFYFSTGIEIWQPKWKTLHFDSEKVYLIEMPNIPIREHSISPIKSEKSKLLSE